MKGTSLLVLSLTCFQLFTCAVWATRPTGLGDGSYTGKQVSVRLALAKRRESLPQYRDRVEPASAEPAVAPTEPAAAGPLPQPGETAPGDGGAAPTGQAVDPSTVALPAEPSAAEALDIATAAAAGVTGPVEQSTAEPTGTTVAPAAAPACASQYVRTDITPARMMWNSSYGYCGESSLQMILTSRGVWIGQQQARSLAGCGSNDLILNTRGTKNCNAFTFIKNKLGFDAPGNSYWDYYNTTDPVTRAPLTATDFLKWVKQQIIAGRPVMLGVRLSGDTDPDYDHIVPFWGVCSTDTRANAALLSSDVFSLSTDLADEIYRARSDPGMFAAQYKCIYAFKYGQGGCIPNDVENYGLAVGQLKDTTNILVKTVKLVILSWSNTFWNQAEPGEPPSTAGSATATYRLSVTGLVPDATYTTWRMQGSLPTPIGGVPTVPSSYSALQTRCTSLGSLCKIFTYRAPASGAVDLNQTVLGTFAANSLQYFLTVRKP